MGGSSPFGRPRNVKSGNVSGLIKSGQMASPPSPKERTPSGAPSGPRSSVGGGRREDAREARRRHRCRHVGGRRHRGTADLDGTGMKVGPELPGPRARWPLTGGSGPPHRTAARPPRSPPTSPGARSRTSCDRSRGRRGERRHPRRSRRELVHSRRENLRALRARDFELGPAEVLWTLARASGRGERGRPGPLALRSSSTLRRPWRDTMSAL